MAQKRTTLRGWKKPEDGKSSACRLISSFVCIFGGIKWDCSKSLTIDCAERLRTNPSVPGQGKAGIPGKGMDNFIYTIDQGNVKVSTITQPGWSGNPLCWATRKDGSCG